VAYRFDPELAELVADVSLSTIENLPEARANIAEMSRAGSVGFDLRGVSFEDRTIPGPADAPDVPIRIYRPGSPEAVAPAVLYLHGGGFVLGSIETEHAGAASLARALGSTVVSVEYRLAPEAPFPAGLEDCYAALVWLAADAGSLGVDPDRIAVFGQSAGGGLAAGVALAARDRGGPNLCFQFLGIPELDDRLETPSMRAFVDTPLWNRPNAVLSWRYYLGDEPGEVSPYAAPARATDLSGLPPAYVSTMEFDPLRDEGIEYAVRLLRAGVPVELHSFSGTFHGSALFAQAQVSKRVYAESLQVLAKALGVSLRR
jgi:acetyl esterase